MYVYNYGPMPRMNSYSYDVGYVISFEEITLDNLLPPFSRIQIDSYKYNRLYLFIPCYYIDNILNNSSYFSIFMLDRTKIQLDNQLEYTLKELQDHLEWNDSKKSIISSYNSTHSSLNFSSQIRRILIHLINLIREELLAI